MALALVVAILDVIPMIGATLGAVIVSAIGLATDLKVGIACIIFYIVYQQVENYLIYPRVMSRSVDIPGAMTVIAALVGACLLGVVGALLAIPTAAAIMLLVREVFIRKQDALASSGGQLPQHLDEHVGLLGVHPVAGVLDDDLAGAREQPSHRVLVLAAHVARVRAGDPEHRAVVRRHARRGGPRASR